MRAGRLRHLMTLQEATETKDAFGAAVRSWSDVVNVRAYLKPIASSEAVSAGATQLRVTHEIGLRYRSGVSAKHRLVFGTRTFKIVSVTPDETSRRLTLECCEVQEATP